MHLASVRIRVIVFSILGLTFLDGQFAVQASPPSNAEWSAYKRRAVAAEARGDFALAATIASELHSLCLSALGDKHPDTTVAAAAVREYRGLMGLDGQARQQLAKMTTRLREAWQEIDRLAQESLPSVSTSVGLLTTFHDCLQDIPPGTSATLVYRGDCYFGTARVLFFTREFEAARSFDVSACEAYGSLEGLEVHGKASELALAAVLSELGRRPDEQLALSHSYADFAERHETTPRIAWWKERAMTQLAETHFRLGNREEADRLYAEVRSRLPDKIDHSIAGWCKSWCDRHEARQLMEKGDWDAAYEKILQARVGTIDYGHRNLSKGLTMERILRMSAEIQRKRGNNKEADEDQEYADLIARHAVRLRTAVEAELKNLRESEANATPQPLPAPSP